MAMETGVNTSYSDLQKDYEKQTSAPFTDGLTGLFNYGFFLEVLKRELKHSRRNSIPFSVLMIDIDGFRHYNHQHGSMAGDRVLRETAEVMRRNLRGSDLAARYVSDQFVVILSETEMHEAEIAVKRIEEGIEERFKGEITACMGCVSSRGSQDADGLIEKAREAVSSAKLQGKGARVLAGPESLASDERRHSVLVVDDEPTNVRLLEAMLKPLGHHIMKASNGDEALRIVGRAEIDLVLLDAMMPYMDGFEACRRLKQSAVTRMIPVIMVTALDDRDSKVRAIEAGADDFVTKPPDRIELTARIRALIRTKQLNDRYVSLENVLFSLANAVEAKDAYTQGHVKRVSNLAVHLGRLIELPIEDLEALRVGGILHDIGKIGIPDSVLNKPGRLDPAEWELMKAHPDVGHRMAEPLRSILKAALDVIRHHHEKLDGSGYPDGLRGEDISVVARIMAVADFYHALITDRPYRRGMSREEALMLMKREATEGRLDDTVVSRLGSLVSGLDGMTPEDRG